MRLGFKGRSEPPNDRPIHTGSLTVLCWMQNGQRPADDPVLDQAMSLANERGAVVSDLSPL